MENKPKVIAFYLPQYYPTDTNNKWYGEGFTEWTNVAKAKPLFKNHYQPKIPANLGFYDLRYPEIREKQSELAKEAGIYGFCYYHYWFGNGKMELEIPFKEVLKSKRPDFPFCLCWANQSWYSKFWNNDIECAPQLIVEQKYDDNEWIEKHFFSLLDAFKDERYIKIDNKPLFMIYRLNEYPEVGNFIKIWRKLAIDNGFNGMYFVAQATTDIQINNYLQVVDGGGVDSVNVVRKDDYLKTWKYSNIFSKLKNKAIRLFGGAPYHYDYSEIYRYFVNKKVDSRENVFPTLVPNWDHSPRSGKRASIFHNSTPENFEKHLIDVLKTTSEKTGENIIFLKSWNEWGEGNYIEPDLKYGKGYLEILKKHLKK